ncbi:FadR/GntR family transcriptional regulator [Oceanobacillus jeddahense]|uniref:FadR family transcriptional regulator n=1 Tax=Oceanobacillus jeddahense TaxID=1462527 RepID=A0ABY5JQQ6_9BACI|nr:FadR/GntR family transcriptional regulator [Oceanobacillus jeddahense]UUI02625.1 FadR family transcriptional regulator [Oceanobacillus jeddahense]
MIVRQRISNQIIEEIKNKIKSGEFPVNSKLPSENELAKMFNVSRVPIREALSALSSHGIIESVHGGGSWVRPKPIDKLLNEPLIEVISYKQIIELLETRIILETKAASLAAQRHNDDDLNKMYLAQEMFFKELDDTNKINDQSDFLFHQSIVHATKNEVLIRTLENLSEIYNRALKASLSINTKIEGKKKQVYEEHQLILKAISLRNAEEAEAGMLSHLSNSLDKLKSRRDEFE